MATVLAGTPPRVLGRSQVALFVRLGRLTILATVVYAFGTFQLSPVVFGIDPPAETTLLLLGLAIGCVLTAPAAAVRRLPVSLPLLGLVALQVLSRAWTRYPPMWKVELLEFAPAALALAAVAGVLPRLEDIVEPIVTGVRAVVVITIASLVLWPQYTVVSADQTGWHGMFGHKNQMAPLLVLGLAAVLVFDTSRWRKRLTVAAIVWLVVGAQSATGLSGILVVVGVLWWLRRYLAIRVSARPRPGFVALSVVAAIVAAAAIAVALPAVVNLYGKDLTFTGRTDIWSAVMDVYRRWPVLGTGLGGLWYDPADPVTAALQRAIGFYVAHAHNGPIELLLDLGAVGLLVFCGLLVGTVRTAWRVLLERPTVALWTLTSVMALLVMSISEPLFSGAWPAWLGLLHVVCLRQRFGTLPDSARQSAP